jgi:hypothetical protein
MGPLPIVEAGGAKMADRMKKAVLVMAALVVASMALAASALAAPPANDTRPNAQQIQLGQNVNGNTTDATADDDDSSGCGPSDTPSVWYRLDSNESGRAIVQLQANGDLDVVVDVYERVRSQFNSLSCDSSDRRGRASTDFRIKKGASYLIRVSQQAQSVSGSFSLLVDIGQPPASAPGKPLPRKGATGTVQRVFEPSNAYSTTMREGVTYRINLAPQSCTRLSIYGPGASDFDGRAQRVLSCGGYTLFTPGAHESGRYSFLIEANSSRRTPQSYRLMVGRAKSDDTAPGKFVRNHSAVRGGLNANRLDVQDLYRFDVTSQSITDLVLRTPSGADYDLVLVGANGHRINCACGGGGNENIHTRTPIGRYFVLIRAHRHARGKYRLSRASKTITSTSLTPVPRAQTSGNGSVQLQVGVTPASVGPVTILVERFDPVNGWQFVKRFETRISGSSTSVSFQPPSVGRYRAQATFNGTRIAAGSRSRVEHFRVEEPLRD